MPLIFGCVLFQMQHVVDVQSLMPMLVDMQRMLAPCWGGPFVSRAILLSGLVQVGDDSPARATRMSLAALAYANATIWCIRHD